ncbi:M1 family peptidase [Halomonas sp. ML-15]|uniref:M1 family metallopeptidase n=1 Tax=Halomonas sp. ML-15 TaxID=2773305 RepID=UPI00174738F9|nr:M1 family aminopeptidase [Halomonas sp. ML-15]MBD3897534.1 M1 family peptidase [Halomonas sp. ML-15]
MAGTHHRLGSLLTLLAGLSILPSGTAVAEALSHKTMRLWLDPANGGLRGELEISPAPAANDIRLLPGLEITLDEHDGERRLIHWQGHLEAAHQQRGLRLSEAGSFLPARASWYPSLVDSPFSLSLTLELPPGQRAVASGSLFHQESDSDINREHYRHPRSDSIEVAAGPWQLRERDLGEVRLRTLFPAALDDAFAETYLAHAARYLVMFEERLGDYPFTSFTMAATPDPVGLAFPGFTLLGERVIPLPFIPRTSLAHELMHAWWGTGVRLDHMAGNWSEALTTYLADYHLDELRGEALETRTRWLTDLAALPADREHPLIAFRGGRDPAMRLIGYQHGAMVLHMLRQRIGDAAFDRALRRLVETHMFHEAGWDDLQAAFEEAADTSLEAFFTAWLTQPGRPRLALDDAQSTARDDHWQLDIVLHQHGDAGPWPLYLPLVIETRDGEVQRTIEMDRTRQRVSLELEVRPLGLQIDPQMEVLRELSDPPATLRALMLATDVDVIAVSPGSESLAHQLLGQRPAAAQTTTADEQARLQLVVGLSDDVEAWLETQGMEAAPGTVRRGTARMWHHPDRPLVVLSADSQRGLGQLAGALRHQGQYSYVTQNAEGDTLDTGRWPLGRGLAWDFDD